MLLNIEYFRNTFPYFSPLTTQDMLEGAHGTARAPGNSAGDGGGAGGGAEQTSRGGATAVRVHMSILWGTEFALQLSMRREGTVAAPPSIVVTFTQRHKSIRGWRTCMLTTLRALAS